MSLAEGFPAAATLDFEQFSAAFQALKQRVPITTEDGRPVMLGRKLGGGGTKTVYQAQLPTEPAPVALALPNKVDGAGVAASKWHRALREPAATGYLREHDLLVNNRCEVVPVAIGGALLPAIVLTPYAQLPFEVRDHKNSHSSSFRSQFFKAPADMESLHAAMDGMLTDIATLTRAGIQLGGDSFNVARTDEGLRLYFNDLGNARVEPFKEEGLIHDVGWQASTAIDALANGLTPEEYQCIEPVLDGVGYYSNQPGQIILAQEIAARL